MIPVYLSICSLLVIVVSIVWNSKLIRSRVRKLDTEDGNENWEYQNKTTVGLMTRVLEWTRSVSLVLILGLSVAKLVQVNGSHRRLDYWKLEAAQCALYVRQGRSIMMQN